MVSNPYLIRLNTSFKTYYNSQPSLSWLPPLPAHLGFLTILEKNKNSNIHDLHSCLGLPYSCIGQLKGGGGLFCFLRLKKGPWCFCATWNDRPKSRSRGLHVWADSVLTHVCPCPMCGRCLCLTSCMCVKFVCFLKEGKMHLVDWCFSLPPKAVQKGWNMMVLAFA